MKKTKGTAVAKVSAAEIAKTTALVAAGLAETATVADVVRHFKKLTGEAAEIIMPIMRKQAELAGLLADGYGLTQEQIGDKLDRSQAWVSQILKWRRGGYKAVAFGPETRSLPAPRQPALAANNPPSGPTVRAGEGEAPLDTSKMSSHVKSQLGIPEPMTGVKFALLAKLASEGDGGARRDLVEAGAKLVNGQWEAPDDKPVTVETITQAANAGLSDAVAEEAAQAGAAAAYKVIDEQSAIHPKSAEDIADDCLSAFKHAAQALLDHPTELGVAVTWFNKDFATERTKAAAKRNGGQQKQRAA